MKYNIWVSMESMFGRHIVSTISILFFKKLQMTLCTSSTKKKYPFVFVWVNFNIGETWQTIIDTRVREMTGKSVCNVASPEIPSTLETL